MKTREKDEKSWNLLEKNFQNRIARSISSGKMSNRENKNGAKPIHVFWRKKWLQLLMEYRDSVNNNNKSFFDNIFVFYFLFYFAVCIILLPKIMWKSLPFCASSVRKSTCYWQIQPSREGFAIIKKDALGIIYAGKNGETVHLPTKSTSLQGKH